MKPNKTLLGIFTFVPFIGGIILSIWGGITIFELIAAEAQGQQLSENEVLELLFSDFLSIALIAAALGLIGFGITIYYIVLAVQSKTLTSGMKVMWILLLFFFSGIAKIIYYFAEVLPDKEEVEEEQFV